ncbi:hypothetical protein [Halomonas sp. MS1]|nr:hypothetical protein [Halomonas sp. MS1]UTD57742.1 hypothetical protein NF683_08275 [Halomonas sp. MS1]
MPMFRVLAASALVLLTQSLQAQAQTSADWSAYNKLQIGTQPNQASSAINRFQPARFSVGPVTLNGEYALLVSPQQFGAALRY